MTTPTVTEITRVLEAVGPDVFVDGPDDLVTLAEPSTRHSATALRGPRDTEDRV